MDVHRAVTQEISFMPLHPFRRDVRQRSVEFSNRMVTYTSDAGTPSSGKISLLNPWKAIYYRSKTAQIFGT
jgi:hypothetical protein